MVKFVSGVTSSLLALATVVASPVFGSPLSQSQHASRGTLQSREVQDGLIAPKVVIISMFTPEQDVWYNIPEFDLNGANITLPGLSPLFPTVHCTADGEVCQITVGEGVINAAASIGALIYSDRFNFTQTYFVVAGIAGINPEVATIGSVAFAQWAVDVDLQYEFDVRDMPENFTTGYVPFGAKGPMQYPTDIYGTEAFELNGPLRSIAATFARRAALSDSPDAQAYRALYATESPYTAGAAPPAIVECDVTTSDTWFSGAYMSTMAHNYVHLMTNGSALYCTTAQEDNATLGILVRAALAQLVDFTRIIVMRSGSNFDRPHALQTATQNLLWENSGGFGPSVENLYRAGIEVVQGILEGWNETFAAGVEPGHYVGDIFGTLGGEPNFGPGSRF